MRAAVFHDAKDIRVEDVAEPTSVGPHEVRLKPFWCGICGTDLHEYAVGPIVIPTSPHPLNGSTAPQILGHEFSGEVLEVGAEVTAVGVGDRVSVMPLLFCGACYFCRRGLNHLCTSMACVGLSDAWGGIAEQCVVPESKVSKLPDSMTDIQGALVEPTAVAAYGIDPAPGIAAAAGVRLQPVMSLRSQLVNVKSIPAGAGVSYGLTWTADRATTVGLVPLGYGDGIPRHASNRAAVGWTGGRAPIRVTIS